MDSKTEEIKKILENKMPSKKQVAISLDRGLIDTMKRWSKELGISFSMFCNTLLNSGMAELEAEEKKMMEDAKKCEKREKKLEEDRLKQNKSKEESKE